MSELKKHLVGKSSNGLTLYEIGTTEFKISYGESHITYPGEGSISWKEVANGSALVKIIFDSLEYIPGNAIFTLNSKENGQQMYPAAGVITTTNYNPLLQFRGHLKGRGGPVIPYGGLIITMWPVSFYEYHKIPESDMDSSLKRECFDVFMAIKDYIASKNPAAK